MKNPLKLSHSKSSSSHGSPLSSPIVADPASPRSPISPSTSKPASKSFLAEKRKSLQLRLPSLPRSRSRGSKRETTTPTSSESSPKPPLSPLGRSSSDANMHAQPMQNNGSLVAGTKPEPLIEEMKRVFEKFDSNGDGRISADELQCVLRALGDNVTRKEAELMVAEVDTDKDGYIDLQEFINLSVHGSGVNGQTSAESTAADELVAAFNMFDLDKNGCITPNELHCVLGNLGNHFSTLEDCKRMICSVDRKGCGYVDFDDFKIMMTRGNTTIMA